MTIAYGTLTESFGHMPRGCRPTEAGPFLHALVHTPDTRRYRLVDLCYIKRRWSRGVSL